MRAAAILKQRYGMEAFLGIPEPSVHRLDVKWYVPSHWHLL